MQYHVGMLGPGVRTIQIGGAGNVNVPGEPLVVTMILQPAAIGMILHGAKLVLSIEPDRELHELLQSILGHDVPDALQVIGQGYQRFLAHLPMLIEQQIGTDYYGPTFYVATGQLVGGFVGTPEG